MDEPRLERALRAGPPFASGSVVRPLLLDLQVARHGPANARRLLTIVAVVGLLLVAVVAALVIGQVLRKDGPGALTFIREDGIYVASFESGELRQVLPGVPDGDGGWCPSGPAGACGSARLTNISTDGSRLAFSVGREPDRDGFYTTTDLYVVNADGSDLRLVHRDHGRIFFPTDSLSPDGHAVAFTQAEGSDGTRTLVIVDLDGGERHAVGNAVTPKWSPDSTSIAFIRPEGTGSDVWAMNADGTDQHLVVRGPGDVEWSPDSGALALVRYGDLRIIDLATMESGPIIGRGLTEIAWSPDGRLIAGRHGEALLVIATDGSSQIEVAAPEILGNIAWSRDGRWLVWAEGRDDSRVVMAYDTVDGSIRTLIDHDELGEGAGQGAPGFLLVPE